MKKTAATIAMALALSAGLTACMPAGTSPSDAEEVTLIQFEEPEEGQTIAIVSTTMGDFSMMLFEEEAPLTTAQFITLVEEGYYDQKTIYCVNQSNHLIWAGATDETGQEGVVVDEEADPIEVEFSQNLWHFTGAVSAFGIEDEGLLSTTVEADSRFFIVGYTEPDADVVEAIEDYYYPDAVVEAYKEYGGQPTYTGEYTVFGHVYEGMEVVEEILLVTVMDEQEYEYIYQPVEDIVINSITLSTYSSTEN